MSCSVVVLAAGQGKRMYSQYSKVLHTLAGRPFVHHVIETVEKISANPLIVVHGYLGEQVQDSLKKHQITWAEQNPPQGTGHAVQQALTALPKHGVTLILYGDVPLIRLETLEALVEQAKKEVLALLVLKTDMPDGYGRILRNPETTDIIGIIEQKDATKEQLNIKEINTGIMAIPTQWLHEYLPDLDNNNVQNEYYLTDIIGMAASASRKVVALYPRYDWEVTGVNDRIQQAELERKYQLFQAYALMKKGVSLRDPNRFDLRGELICGQDVEIDVNCIFEGNVTIESGVKIAAHCVIRNSHLRAGVTIEAFSHIDGADVGAHSKVGPFARLRPAARLSEHVHIGNFVEIKNSFVQEYSKINHLSYVGDSDIGKRVNIGAGTITCNYDGVNKFRTVIGDDVFVGSATQLVAPISVASGVTIAAGTTVWKDISAEKVLVRNKKEHVVCSTWLRPVKAKGK